MGERHVAKGGILCIVVVSGAVEGELISGLVALERKGKSLSSEKAWRKKPKREEELRSFCWS